MSIAAQLRVLSGGDKRIEQVNRKKDSFLFDAKVAADTDAQTIFNLSRNGLAELIKLNQHFSAFESSLFARVPDSSYIANLNSDAKKKLDFSISCFLRLLSPYFLNKASHKCLEFLIRCYNIQERNVDSLIACILPYHETGLFPKMLRIVKLDVNPIFDFLNVCKKQGVALSRATLVQRCIVDHGFLSFLCDLGKPSTHKSLLLSIFSTKFNTAVIDKSYVSFVTITLIDMLTYIDKVSDELLTILLPYILSSIHSSTHDCQISGYMVVTHVCSLIHLKPHVLEEIIVAMCNTIPTKDVTAKSLQYPILSLLAICNHQYSVLQTFSIHNEIPILPKRAFDALLQCKPFVSSLLIASQKYNINNLLWPYIHSLCIYLCVPEVHTNNFVMNMNCVDALTEISTKLNIQPHFKQLVCWLLSAFTVPYTQKESMSADKWRDTYVKVLRTICLNLDFSYKMLMAESISYIFEYVCTEDKEIKPFTTMDYFIKYATASEEDVQANTRELLSNKYDAGIAELKTPKDIVIGLFQDVFQNTRHEILASSNTTLILSSSHSSAKVRLHALDRLDNLVEEVATSDDSDMKDQDDELAFLSNDLLDDASIMKPTTTEVTKDVTPTVDPVPMLIQRFTSETDVDVLNKLYSLQCLMNPRIVPTTVVFEYSMLLCTKLFQVLSIGVDSGKIVDHDDSKAKNSITNVTGACVIINTIFTFMSKYIDANQNEVGMEQLLKKFVPFYLEVMYLSTKDSNADLYKLYTHVLQCVESMKCVKNMLPMFVGIKDNKKKDNTNQYVVSILAANIQKNEHLLSEYFDIIKLSRQYHLQAQKLALCVLDNLIGNKKTKDTIISTCIDIILYTINDMYILQLTAQEDMKNVLQVIIANILDRFQAYKYVDNIKQEDWYHATNTTFMETVFFNYELNSEYKISTSINYANILLRVYLLSLSSTPLYVLQNTVYSQLLSMDVMTLITSQIVSIPIDMIGENVENINIGIVENIYLSSIQQYMNMLATPESVKAILPYIFIILNSNVRNIRDVGCQLLKNIVKKNLITADNEVSKVITILEANVDTLVLDNTLGKKILTILLGDATNTSVNMHDVTLSSAEQSALVELFVQEIYIVKKMKSISLYFNAGFLLELLPSHVITDDIMSHVITIVQDIQMQKSEKEIDSLLAVFVKQFTVYALRTFIKQVSQLVKMNANLMLPVLLPFLCSNYTVTFANYQITFSVRDLILQAISSSMFKLVDKKNQQLLLDTLFVLYTYVPSNTDGLLYPSVSSQVLMDILYNARISCSLFVSYLQLNKKNGGLIENITQMGYTSTLCTLKVMNLLFSQENATSIKNGAKLLPSLFILLKGIVKFSDKYGKIDEIEEDSENSEEDEESMNVKIMPRVHAMLSELLQTIFYTLIQNPAMSVDFYTVEDIELVMIVLRMTLVVPKVHGNALFTASLEDPQCALTRDISLQCFSFFAVNSKQLIIPYILEISTMILTCIQNEEEVAIELHQPSPSLINSSSTSPICTSVNVINGSYLDIYIRAIRSIIGPVICVSNLDEEMNVTIAALFRYISDYALFIHSNTVQIILASTLRYVTMGGLNMDDDDDMPKEEDEDMDDEDMLEEESGKMIYFSIPLDISTETELDALVSSDMIAGMIALILARAHIPLKLKLSHPEQLPSSSNRHELVKPSTSVELIDVSQRLLLNYAPDVQVSIITNLVPLIYIYTQSTYDGSDSMSMIEGYEYYMSKNTFILNNDKALQMFRVGVLQFINTISAGKEFRNNIISLSRTATQTHVYDGTVMDRDEAKHTLEILGSAFVNCFARLFCSIDYAENMRSTVYNSNNAMNIYWRTIVQSTENVIQSMLSLLTTHHFATVFKDIFKYSLNPEDTNAKILLSLQINDDLIVITRKHAIKRLLMLLIERLRIERERIHAESFIHVINEGGDTMNHALNKMDSVNDEYIEDYNIDSDAEDEDGSDLRKQLWIQQLHQRETALLSIIPSLNTQLFYPFLNFYVSNSADKKMEEGQVGVYNAENDLENLQVAMLCIDELSDLVCLMLSPLSSPSAAMAALSGVGSKRPVVQLPKKVLSMLLDIYNLVLKVSTLAANETFLHNNDNITWPTLLSSSLLCMSTLATRTGIQSLQYLNKLAPLSLAVLDKVCILDEKVTIVEEETVSKSKTKKTKTVTPEFNINTLPKETRDLLMLSALSVVDTLLRSSSQFLAPYLTHILSVVLHDSLPENNPISSSDLRFTSALSTLSVNNSVNNAATSESNDKMSFIASGGLVSSCLQALANYVTPRVLLPAIYNNWQLCVSRGCISTCRLLALVGKVCNTLNSISEESIKGMKQKVDSMNDGDEEEEKNNDDEENLNFDDNTVDDDYIDFSENEERNVSNYISGIRSFFFDALELRKKQANPQDDGYSFNTLTSGNNANVMKSAPGVLQYTWSVSQYTYDIPTSKKLLLWSDIALQSTEEALEQALLQFIYKVDEITLKQTFAAMVDWVEFHDKLPSYKDDKSGMAQLIVEHLPQLIPFYRIVYSLMSNLRHIFLPYVVDILDDIIVLLSDHGKHNREERQKVKELTKKKKNGKRANEDDMEDEEDTVLDASEQSFLRKYGTVNIWRASNTVYVVKTIHSALQSDTIMARGSYGQTTAVFSKADMERLIPVLAGHIEISFALRQHLPANAGTINKMLVYPEFIDTCLNPCLGQLSVHLAYSSPAMWDTLATSTLVQSKHVSPMVRFAVLSALHLYILRNNEDFLLLLPKIIGYVAELMQDTNILVEKLAQDVIKSIEKISGESLKEYLQ